MKYRKICRELVVAIAVSFAANLLSGLAFAAHAPPETPALPNINCQAVTPSGSVNIPQASQDSDHIYFSGHDASATYDAVFHIRENFVYLLITTGPASNPIKVSGNFLLNGVGLSATLTYAQGSQISQLVCAE